MKFVVTVKRTELGALASTIINWLHVNHGNIHEWSVTNTPLVVKIYFSTWELLEKYIKNFEIESAFISYTGWASPSVKTPKYIIISIAGPEEYFLELVTLKLELPNAISVS